jgi:hypothetical protein
LRSIKSKTNRQRLFSRGLWSLLSLYRSNSVQGLYIIEFSPGFEAGRKGNPKQFNFSLTKIGDNHTFCFKRFPDKLDTDVLAENPKPPPPSWNRLKSNSFLHVIWKAKRPLQISLKLLLQTRGSRNRLSEANPTYSPETSPSDAAEGETLPSEAPETPPSDRFEAALSMQFIRPMTNQQMHCWPIYFPNSHSAVPPRPAVPDFP